MLVLTRKLKQQIKIGDGITVTILRVRGNQVRVGIEAPEGMRVLRTELKPFESEAPAEARTAERTNPLSAASRLLGNSHQPAGDDLGPQLGRKPRFEMPPVGGAMNPELAAF